MVEENLIREFIAEAEEHLFTLEPNLLRLEKEPDNLELVNEIFLATHGIKGTSAYVGLLHISNFTHSLETLLDQLRKQTLRASPEIIDILLEGVDSLKQLIRNLSQGEPAPDTSAVVEKLTRWNNDDAERQQTPLLPQSETCQPQHEAVMQENNLKHSSTKPCSFIPTTLELDPEDSEIFADIANQQLEFMEMAVEKIWALYEDDRDDAREQAVETLKTLIKAFRNIQSSAMMLDVEALNEILDEHAQYFLHIEYPEFSLETEDIQKIERILIDLKAMTAAIQDVQTTQTPALTPEEPDAPPEMLASIHSISDISPEQYTLRVNAERVDHLLNLVGELVINRARLVQFGKEIKMIYEDLRTGDTFFRNTTPLHRKKNLRIFKKLKEDFDGVILDLGRLTNQIQEGTMRIRMIPISQVVNRLPRMVRDLSRQAGKKIEIRINGAETELDKTVVDVIGDPLIHIIRNAIDHGLESPDERQKQGKPPEGRILLSAYHQGNQVVIEVEDDGRGVDIERVKIKALQLNLITSQEAEMLQDKDIAYLIFHSGFSTVETVSNLSGRGVGLNVVKRYLEKLNGAIELESVPGKGCKFTIKLPLTLAIIPALMVSVNTEIFAIPLIAVEEAIRIEQQDIDTIESHKVIYLRERMVPLVELTDLLGTPVFQHRQTEQDSSADDMFEKKTYGVIISDGFREIGLIVDALLGESDIVIKSLKDELVNVEGVSGASIRGDGEVSLVLDAVSLINLAITHIRRSHRTRKLLQLDDRPEKMKARY